MTAYSVVSWGTVGDGARMSSPSRPDKVPLHSEGLGSVPLGVLVWPGRCGRALLLPHPGLHDQHPVCLPLYRLDLPQSTRLGGQYRGRVCVPGGGVCVPGGGAC